MHSIASLGALVFTAALCACGSPASSQDAGADSAPPTTPITLRFAAMVGSQPFACGTTFHGLGTTSTDWNPGDFRFYVSSIRLIDSSGNETPVTLDEDQLWQHAGVGLLDFEDKTGGCSAGTTQTHDRLTGTVPTGTYVGVRFDLGIPFDLDHADVSVAPSPLDITGMFWSWESGYKFLKIEGSSTGVPDGYNIHLGSTGCTSDATGHVVTPCTTPNLPTVTLMGFDPSRSVVVADLAALTSASNLDVNTMDTPPGCMSASMDPECTSLFGALGLAYDSSPAPAAGQRFFRLQ